MNYVQNISFDKSGMFVPGSNLNIEFSTKQTDSSAGLLSTVNKGSGVSVNDTQDILSFESSAGTAICTYPLVKSHQWETFGDYSGSGENAPLAGIIAAGEDFNVSLGESHNSYGINIYTAPDSWLNNGTRKNLSVNSVSNRIVHRFSADKGRYEISVDGQSWNLIADGLRGKWYAAVSVSHPGASIRANFGYLPLEVVPSDGYEPGIFPGSYNDAYISQTNPLFFLPLSSGSSIIRSKGVVQMDATRVGNVSYSPDGLYPESGSHSFPPNAYLKFKDTRLNVAEDLSLFSWVNISSLSNYSCIISLGGSSESSESNLAYLLYVQTDGSVAFLHEYDAGVNQKVATAPGLISVGGTYHIGATRDSSSKSVTIFINGEPVYKDSYSIDTSGNTLNELFIGSQEEIGASYEKKMSSCVIYNRAISETEASNLYSVATTGVISSAPFTSYYNTVNSLNPVHNYRMEDSSGVIAEDYASGNTLISDSYGFKSYRGKDGLSLGNDSYSNSYLKASGTSNNLRSVNIWMKSISGKSSGFSVLSRHVDNSYNWRIGKSQTGNFPEVFYNGSGSPSISADASIELDDRWNMVTVVYDGISTTRMYINGKIQTGSFSGNIFSTAVNGDMFLGARMLSGSIEADSCFSGQVDEVSMFESSLTSSDINKLYISGSLARDPGNSFYSEVVLSSPRNFYPMSKTYFDKENTSPYTVDVISGKKALYSVNTGLDLYSTERIGPKIAGKFSRSVDQPVVNETTSLSPYIDFDIGVPADTHSVSFWAYFNKAPSESIEFFTMGGNNTGYNTFNTYSLRIEPDMTIVMSDGTEVGFGSNAVKVATSSPVNIGEPIHITLVRRDLSPNELRINGEVFKSLGNSDQVTYSSGITNAKYRSHAKKILGSVSQDQIMYISQIYFYDRAVTEIESSLHHSMGINETSSINGWSPSSSDDLKFSNQLLLSSHIVDNVKSKSRSSKVLDKGSVYFEISCKFKSDQSCVGIIDSSYLSQNLRSSSGSISVSRDGIRVGTQMVSAKTLSEEFSVGIHYDSYGDRVGIIVDGSSMEYFNTPISGSGIIVSEMNREGETSEIVPSPSFTYSLPVGSESLMSYNKTLFDLNNSAILHPSYEVNRSGTRVDVSAPQNGKEDDFMMVLDTGINAMSAKLEFKSNIVPHESYNNLNIAFLVGSKSHIWKGSKDYGARVNSWSSATDAIGIFRINIPNQEVSPYYSENTVEQLGGGHQKDFIRYSSLTEEELKGVSPIVIEIVATDEEQRIHGSRNAYYDTVVKGRILSSIGELRSTFNVRLPFKHEDIIKQGSTLKLIFTTPDMNKDFFIEDLSISPISNEETVSVHPMSVGKNVSAHYPSRRINPLGHEGYGNILKTLGSDYFENSTSQISPSSYRGTVCKPCSYIKAQDFSIDPHEDWMIVALGNFNQSGNAWKYLLSTAQDANLSGEHGGAIGLSNENKLNYWINNTGLGVPNFNVSGTVAIGQHKYICICKTGNEVRVYGDGILRDTIDISQEISGVNPVERLDLLMFDRWSDRSTKTTSAIRSWKGDISGFFCMQHFDEVIATGTFDSDDTVDRLLALNDASVSCDFRDRSMSFNYGGRYYSGGDIQSPKSTSGDFTINFATSSSVSDGMVMRVEDGRCLNPPSGLIDVSSVSGTISVKMAKYASGSSCAIDPTPYGEILSVPNQGGRFISIMYKSSLEEIYVSVDGAKYSRIGVFPGVSPGKLIRRSSSVLSLVVIDEALMDHDVNYSYNSYITTLTDRQGQSSKLTNFLLANNCETLYSMSGNGPIVHDDIGSNDAFLTGDISRMAVDRSSDISSKDATSTHLEYIYHGSTNRKNNSLFIQDNNFGSCVSLSSHPQCVKDGKFTMSMAFYLTKKGSTRNMQLYRLSGPDERFDGVHTSSLVNIRIFTDSKPHLFVRSRYTDGGSNMVNQPSSKEISLGWNLMHVVIDLSSNYAKLYINGELFVENTNNSFTQASFLKDNWEDPMGSGVGGFATYNYENGSQMPHSTPCIIDYVSFSSKIYSEKDIMDEVLLYKDLISYDGLDLDSLHKRIDFNSGDSLLQSSLGKVEIINGELTLNNSLSGRSLLSGDLTRINIGKLIDDI